MNLLLSLRFVVGDNAGKPETDSCSNPKADSLGTSNNISKTPNLARGCRRSLGNDQNNKETELRKQGMRN